MPRFLVHDGHGGSYLRKSVVVEASSPAQAVNQTPEAGPGPWVERPRRPEDSDHNWTLDSVHSTPESPLMVEVFGPIG
jgi:hypothetical protein